MDECISESGAATLKCIPSLLNNLIYASFAFAGAAAVILIMISGIKFLLSGGDPIKVEQAKRTGTYSIIGLVVISLAFVIVNIVAKVTGADCIMKFLGC